MQRNTCSTQKTIFIRAYIIFMTWKVTYNIVKHDNISKDIFLDFFRILKHEKLTLFHAGITLEYGWNRAGIAGIVIPVVFLLQTGNLLERPCCSSDIFLVWTPFWLIPGSMNSSTDGLSSGVDLSSKDTRLPLRFLLQSRLINFCAQKNSKHEKNWWRRTGSMPSSQKLTRASSRGGTRLGAAGSEFRWC